MATVPQASSSAHTQARPTLEPLSGQRPPMCQQMEKMVKLQQQRIIHCLEAIDGKPFGQNVRDDGNKGGGISAVLQEGNIFEKAGVNVSVVNGTLPRPAIEKMRADHKSMVLGDTESLDFTATGLSIVIHPRNPMAPTVHLNYRYFETFNPTNPDGPENTWWFGGGTDLTPSYLFPEDCIHFHKTLKEVCDRHSRLFYPRFKSWCDEYFYLPNRCETRGIGGIFFDDLGAADVVGFLLSPCNSPPSDLPEPRTAHATFLSQIEAQDRLFAFCSDCVASFIPCYIPIIEKRKDMAFTASEKNWQQIRRGRYVEFNLLYDRGTSFGLRNQSAKTENILMSLPLTARWEYMHPVCGTGTQACENETLITGTERERELLQCLKQPREWA